MDRRFQRLAAGTTGLTFLLVLLGVYTAATGSGLACAQRWPLCDGAVLGLFPATWPSFVEWSHRLVAMVAGLAILGTAVAAWRGGADARIRYATGVAVAVLPVQVLLGAETVWTYTLASRAGHFVAALAILGALAATTAWAFPGPWLRRARFGLVAAAALAAVSFGLGPRGPLVYAPGVQAASTAAGLAAFGLLLAAGLRLPDGLGRARLAALAAAALVAATLVLRRLVYTDLHLAADLAATAAVVGLALAALAIAVSPLSSRADVARSG